MKFTHTHLLVPLALLALAGCMCRPAVMERAQTISQEELVQRLGERTQQWSSYQAGIHIKGESAKGKFRLRAVVLAQLPDQFRLEAFTPLGQTAGVLVFNPTGVSLWIPSEQVIYSAEQAETLIKYFLGIPVPVETFGYSLAASIPPGPLLHGLKALPLDAGWELSSAGAADDLKLTWNFLSQPPALKAVSVGQGLLSYTISYEPATRLDPDQIPGEIRFTSSQWRMEVKIDKMMANPDIQEAAFNLPVSAGARRVRLSEAR